MAKTLVVKGADFSVNAFDRVAFGSVPCESISISTGSITLENIGKTATIEYTVTPANTTDRVRWESSAESIATVEDGVVTAKGVGSTTITARCGSYSATCSVDVKAVMGGVRVLGGYLSGDAASTGGNGLPTIANNAARGAMLADEGTLSFYRPLNNVTYYPYKLPAGVAKIRIDTKSGVIKPDVVEWFNFATAANGQPTVCKLIAKVPLTQFTSLGNNIYEVNVGTYDGYPAIDAMAISFRCYRSGSDTFLQTDLDVITVEFL